MIEAGAYYEKISCERTENKNGESHGAKKKQFTFVLWRLVFFQNNIQNSKSSRYISTVFGDYSNQMAMTRYQYHK